MSWSVVDNENPGPERGGGWGGHQKTNPAYPTKLSGASDPVTSALVV